MRLGRRSVLLGAAAGLGGCGFHPVYGPLSNGQTVRPELAGIFVNTIPERSGQLLRQALQARLAGSGDATKRFELSAGFSIGAEAISVQPDTSSTRTRYVARSTWNLRKFDTAHTSLTDGNARATDGIDINDEQYFALDLEQQTVTRRLAEAVADQIVLDLAVYFRSHPELA